MSDLIKAMPNGLQFLPESKQWKNRFEVRSETSNRLYVIAQNKTTGKWGCSCPGWIVHRHCKHLKAVETVIKVIEQ